MSHARITGEVLAVERKSGNTDGRAWGFTVATILLARVGVAEVTYRDDSGEAPRSGDHVDLLVKVSGNAKGARLTAAGAWPAEVLV